MFNFYEKFVETKSRNLLEPMRKETDSFHFYEKFIVAAHIVVFVLNQITIKSEIVIS